MKTKFAHRDPAWFGVQQQDGRDGGLGTHRGPFGCFSYNFAFFFTAAIHIYLIQLHACICVLSEAYQVLSFCELVFTLAERQEVGYSHSTLLVESHPVASFYF